MRKAAAGLLVGACAAALVLALTNLEAFRTVELKTYDWRLSRTADPSTARQDIALVEIDEYSLRNLQQLAGRWPWPRVLHSSLIEYLNRGRPKLIVYDVLFADEDLRVGFPYGGDTWSGPESDKALADTIRKAGNVVLLADATFVGETTEKQTLPDPGYRLNGPGVLERRVVFPPAGPLSGAAAALGHNFLSLDADGPVRHVVPFVRTGENAMPSLGLLAALRASGVEPSAVRIDGQSLVAGDRLMPLETRIVNTEGGAMEMLWGLIHFRGPAFLPDLKSRPYPHYSFFDLLYSGEQVLAEQKPDIDPGGVPGQDRVRRSDGGGPARCVRNAVRRRDDAGHSSPRVGCRRLPVEPLHAAGIARRAHRARRCLRAQRRRDCHVAAGLVGGGRVRRHHRRIRLVSRHGCSRAATGSTSRSRRSRRRSRCSAASDISTSSKGARSER